MKKIGIYGLGLIGGSMGKALRQGGKFRIYGVDARPSHLEQARKLGLIDEELTPSRLREMDGVVLAVPADAMPDLARRVLDGIRPGAWVTDTGSIKGPVLDAIRTHPRRGRFVAAHPIAGTEYSGPAAARADLFGGKICILCPHDDMDPDATDAVSALWARHLGMEIHRMPAGVHDLHIAYVSHLSHVSAFMLGKTVLDTEDDLQNIFLMAGSGFASTVRLAKSSPDTWTPVFLENKAALLPVLETYRKNLDLFIDLLKNDRKQEIHRLLTEINRIGRIIDSIGKIHGKR